MATFGWSRDSHSCLMTCFVEFPPNAVVYSHGISEVINRKDATEFIWTIIKRLPLNNDHGLDMGFLRSVMLAVFMQLPQSNYKNKFFIQPN